METNTAKIEKKFKGQRDARTEIKERRCLRRIPGKYHKEQEGNEEMMK